MKTLLIILTFGLSFTMTAQPPQHDKKPEQRAERMKHLSPEQQATLITKKMTLDLDLNDSQQDQIYELIHEKTKKHLEREANKPKERPSEDELYQIKLEQIDEQIAMKKAMKSILDDKQYEIWNNMKNKGDQIRKRKKRKKMQQ